MFSRVSSYFYIFSVVLFDNIRQNAYISMFFGVLRLFNLTMLYLYQTAKKCLFSSILDTFRHISTSLVLKYHCSIKYIRSMLVLIIIFSKLHTYIAPIHFVGCPFTIFNFYLTVFQCINQFQYINIKPI